MRIVSRLFRVPREAIQAVVHGIVQNVAEDLVRRELEAKVEAQNKMLRRIVERWEHDR